MLHSYITGPVQVDFDRLSKLVNVQRFFFNLFLCMCACTVVVDIWVMFFSLSQFMYPVLFSYMGYILDANIPTDLSRMITFAMSRPTPARVI